MSDHKIAVALVHHPVLNRLGEPSATAVTSIDVHDFARSCAFYDIAPVYLVHPAEGMHALVDEMIDYWRDGAGAKRNPSRGEALASLKLIDRLENVFDDADYRLWYTSAAPPEKSCVAPAELMEMEGKHLIVFGTGWGLDADRLPKPNGWLSPIEGIGMVRHLSVRAALAIYLDRLRR